jgi:class 3 adenylate cyclase
VFELQLEQTQLKAERLRASVIAVAATIYGLNMSLMSSLYPGMGAELLGHRLRPASVIFSAFLFAGYEFMLRAYLGRTLRSGKPLRREIRYLNALVEISTPTLVLWWLAQGIDPHQVLLTAVPYIYLLFILLSTLRMNLPLSIFTGAMAAVEYLTTAYLFRAQPPTVPLGMLLIAWPHHIMKALFFLTGGFLAGFVGHQIRKGIAETFRDGQECKNAVTCALEMVAQIEALADAGTIPPTRIGIGLHAGPAVTGNVGSSRRKEYTIIGDVVNLASRVESLNKDLGSTVLVTEAVWQAAGGTLPSGTAGGATQAVAQIVDHGPVAVRGREAPVHLFQLA